MPTHRLTRDKGPASEPYVVEWDATTLRVTDPFGGLVFEHPVDRAHRIIETHELDADGKVSFATSSGSLTFKKDAAALRDVRALVMQGLRSDVEYRVAQRRQARRMVPLGVAMFVVFGVPFAAYCWWASWAPDPPPGNWMYAARWPIHAALVVALGLALAGPYTAYMGLRQLARVRRAERSAG